MELIELLLGFGLWLIGQWWAWLIVGLIMLYYVTKKLRSMRPYPHDPKYPTTDKEAGEIALGCLQIANVSSGRWNDPSASSLSESKSNQEALVDLWSLQTRQSWLDNIERLTTDLRRRDLWVSYLAIRTELAGTSGRAPKLREWIKAIREAGGDKKDAQYFTFAVEHIEDKTRKILGKYFPTGTFVTTFDGYALGQAVAVTTWGVALGHCEVSEARAIIARINAIARPTFRSWEEFALSYIAGRVMHWSNGQLDDNTFDRLGEQEAVVAKAALSERRRGPWALNPWTR